MRSDPRMAFGAQGVDRVAATARRGRRVHLVHDQQVELRGVRVVDGREHLISSDWARRSFNQSIDTISRGNDVNTFAPTHGRGAAGEPSVLTIRNSRPNRSRHLLLPLHAKPAGHTTITVRARCRKQKLLDDETRFDRLAETDVVGDQQVGPGHLSARTTGSSW